MAKPMPDGYRTITPMLSIRDAARAIDFYKRALDAQERFRMPGPDGKVAHAELQIGDSVIMLGEEDPSRGCTSPASLKGTPVTFYLYLPDVDAAFKRATGAGATVRMPVSNMFWGDRYGEVEDPFGFRWGLATHVEDLTPEEIARRGQAAMAEMARGKK
ncbi:MAG TPA: VOC family protein [Methylomirabilota bacterium]|nr:VOC family protein [Methylomirabilota bacterium]